MVWRSVISGNEIREKEYLLVLDNKNNRVYGIYVNGLDVRGIMYDIFKIERLEDVIDMLSYILPYSYDYIVTFIYENIGVDVDKYLNKNIKLDGMDYAKIKEYLISLNRVKYIGSRVFLVGSNELGKTNYFTNEPIYFSLSSTDQNRKYIMYHLYYVNTDVDYFDHIRDLYMLDTYIGLNYFKLNDIFKHNNERSNKFLNYIKFLLSEIAENYNEKIVYMYIIDEML